MQRSCHVGISHAGPIRSADWFATDDFDGAVKRARKLSAVILEEPHFNPNARHWELWLRDPDDYVVVLAGASSST
jgi:hypothetical protein